MLDTVLDRLQVKQMARWLSDALDAGDSLGGTLKEDLGFLRTVQHAMLPVPYLDREETLDTQLFSAHRPFKVEALAGKRIGLVATSGSGAAVGVLGVVRALEEAGVQLAAISASSTSALFLAPIAAGMSASETTNWVLSWQTGDYLEEDWLHLLRIPLTLGRGFTGLFNSEVVELAYHDRLGGVMVQDLPVPFYANIWDLKHNRQLHLGTRSTPHVRLARLVRAAVTIPILVQPFELDGALVADGSVLNVFPVEPLVRYHPEIDFFLGINVSSSENFEGEDVSGWPDRVLSPLRLRPQVRRGQSLEAARAQLRLIEDRCLLLNPVSHKEIEGLKYYEQMLDRSRWPEYILRSYYYTRRNLALLDRAQQADPAAGQLVATPAQEW